MQGIEWAQPGPVADPGVVVGLLSRAAEMSPERADVRVRLGAILMGGYDFAAAALAFEAALHIDPDLVEARIGLARCWNRLGRHDDVLALVDAGPPAPSVHGLYQRGIAARALGRGDQAEQEFRHALEQDPLHRETAFELGRILSDAGRLQELDLLSDHLVDCGARHTQLLLNRARVLAGSGHQQQARSLLFSPGQITQTQIEQPAGFEHLEAFNAALANEFVTHPHAMTRVPSDELAMRGGTRINHLLSGRRPDLVKLLREAIIAAIDRDVAERIHAAGDPGGDPWLQFRPARAELCAWASIQVAGAYEDWHSHRAGWLSGVYYVAVPAPFSVEGDGAGCIEFGASTAFADLNVPIQRIAPRAGMLILTPSHFHHRTIPFRATGERITFAFDVRPLA